MEKIAEVIACIAVYIGIYFLYKYYKKQKSNVAEKKQPATMTNNRKCLVCGFTGKMKTWLGNYNGAQFIALLLLLIYAIPGLIFITWAWGKYKCPNCGALGKNMPIQVAPSMDADIK